MAWTDLGPYTVGRFTAAMAELLRGNFKAIGDPWTAYTPAWTATTTNPVLGNGTMTGDYIKAGKFVVFRIRLTMGSTTTFGTGTSYSWSLPFTAVSSSTGDPVGGSTLWDSSASSYFPQHAFLINTTGVGIAYENGNRVSPSSPLAWGTGDKIYIQGAYEAA